MSLLSLSLHKLKSSGDKSFESLVSVLLQQASGFHFHLAKSGDQYGRDGHALTSTGGSVMFECKRYLEKTKISIRELTAELEQAYKDVPTLDVWILATTRDISDQILTKLNDFATEKGFEILSLDCRDDGTGLLDCLCAKFPEFVISALASTDIKNEEILKVRKLLNEISQQDGFESHYLEFRERITKPLYGWPTWQSHSQTKWLNYVGNENSSRAYFGQPLHVLDPSNHPIIRKDSVRELDNWWDKWSENHKSFLVQGEEGDGKSWSVAQWLTEKIKKDSSLFPPVIFISSKNSGNETNVFSVIEKHMIAEFGDHNWKLRLSRWVSSRALLKSPTLILILDGINERNLPSHWRDILESHLAPELQSSIAVICTARFAYWREYFSPLTHLNFSTFLIPPLNDIELKEALERRQLTLENYPVELHPLLRKPRYLDLALKHHKNLSINGDFTVARLIYEDWRDRYQRKSALQISDAAFNDFLRVAAKEHIEGKSRFKAVELPEMLSQISDAQATLIEISTSGVINKTGSHWVVEPNRLSLGLGLLLCDQLQEAEQKNENLNEMIASWIEPHTGMDIQANILEQAVLHSVETSKKEAITTSLLFAWLSIQNPAFSEEDPLEKRFVAYLPSSPESYFRLAEIIWSYDHDHGWGQEVLLNGFIRWGTTSNTIAKALCTVFEKWLGMVPLYGPTIRRRGAKDEDLSDNLKQDLSEILGHEAIEGDIEFEGYSLSIINNDGWLRLGRVALAVISHFLERQQFMPSIVRGVIAEALVDYPSKGDLFSWVIRSSLVKLDEQVIVAIESLSNSKKISLHKAAYRLGNYGGTKEAWAFREKFDEELLFPTPEWLKEASKEPLSNFLPCTMRQFQAYCDLQENFDASVFLRRAKQFIADPKLRLSADNVKLLLPALDQLYQMSFWQGMSHTHENYLIEDMKLPLALYCPLEFSDLIRSVVIQANNREIDALIGLVFELEKFGLLLTKECRKALKIVWEKSSDELLAHGDNGVIAESYIFLILMQGWSAEEQVHYLTVRKAQAFNLLKFEEVFKRDVIKSLPLPVSGHEWGNLIWFLSSTRQALLSSVQIAECLNHSDTAVRGIILRYLYVNGTSAEINDWMTYLNWKWNEKSDYGAQDYGSLLIADYGNDLHTTDMLERISPVYWGYALKKYPTFKAWEVYTNLIESMLNATNEFTVSPSVPQLNFTYDPNIPHSVGCLSIEESEDRSVRFIQRDSVWGGRQPEGMSNLFSDLGIEREKWNAKYDELDKLRASAAESGLSWANRDFLSHGLAEVLQASPQIVKKWIHDVIQDTKQARLQIYKARTFYLSLCEALLANPIWHHEAALLYKTLNERPGFITVNLYGIKLSTLDRALMNAIASESIQTIWEDNLNQATSDNDLLNIALLIRSADRQDGMTWVSKRIEVDLNSPSPFIKAKAISLRGFLETEIEAEWTKKLINNPTFWLDEVLSKAQERVKNDSHAQHWFRLFCRETNEKAWAAFQLFLSCTDRRCWLWLDSLTEEFDLAEDKKQYLQLNKESISKACDKNEKTLKETFLGSKIQDGLWPWMGETTLH